MGSITASLVRRTLLFCRIPTILAPKQVQRYPLWFYSSLASISSTSKLSQNHWKSSLFLPVRFASICRAPETVKADEEVMRVMEEGIWVVQEAIPRLEELFKNWTLFKIIDNPGEQTIILRQEHAGESIKIEVHMPAAEDEGKAVTGTIPFDVTVIKGDGPCLAFQCGAVYEYGILIDRVAINMPEDFSNKNTYEGPHFSDLDEDLRRDFYDYLLARGIDGSFTHSLREYMLAKDRRHYLQWLKKIKAFIEN